MNGGDIFLNGHWQIFEFSSELFPGTLKFTEFDGCTLDLFPLNAEILIKNKHINPKFITGIAPKGIYSLYNCYYAGNSYSNISTFSYKIDYLFFSPDYEIDNNEKLKFNTISAKFSILDNFFRGYNPMIIKQKINKVSKKFELIHKDINLSFKIDEDLKFEIYHGFNNGLSHSEFKFNRFINFSIKSNKAKNIDFLKLIKALNNLRVLFSLFVQGICTYETFGFYRKITEPRIALYVRNEIFGSKNRNEWFKFTEIVNNFEDIITNWYKLVDEIPEVISLFYNVYTSTKYEEYYFRDTYIALEGIFQWKMKKDTKNQNVISILIDQIKFDVNRRTELNEFFKIIDGFKKWEVIARDNRHFQSHLNKVKYEGKILDNHELILYMRKMQAIIIYYILNALSISDIEINKVFGRMNDYYSPKFLI